MMQTFDCGRFRFNLAQLRRPLVMGILNVTPDSFSDGGKYTELEHALNHAEQMIADGVDIIDIGAESTRPGAPALSVQQELDRLMPVIYALRDCGKAISIDTYKPEVMRVAIDAGADMINDVRGFDSDASIAAVTGADVAVCLMHMQGKPETMQAQPVYQDVYAEVSQFLADRVAVLNSAGLGAQQICVDPGFGFGKTQQHNLELFQRLNKLRAALNLPVLVGVSRKSMLGNIVDRAPGQRVVASTVAAVLAAQQNAAIVRVHDVAETTDALKVWQQLGSVVASE